MIIANIASTTTGNIMNTVKLKQLISWGTLIFLTASIPQTATATLMGDTVTASLDSRFIGAITQPFDSPQVVGPDTEFSGIFTDAFGQAWDLALDIGITNFTLGITEQTRNETANVRTTSDLFTISLTDLDFLGGATIIDVKNSGYSCTGGFGCTVTGGGPNISSLIFGINSIYFGLNSIRDGELYTFDIITVSEPSSILLLLLGLIGMGLVKRTNKI